MKISTGFWNCSNLFKTLLIGLLLVPAGFISAQSLTERSSVFTSSKSNAYVSFKTQNYGPEMRSGRQDSAAADSSNQTEQEYPDPNSVMYKSLMIPGWGQVVNKQAWKIPIVYGLLAGVVGYNIYLTKQYHDYRAAYYNVSHEDMRFGPTPDYLSQNSNPEFLRDTRNRLRNRRDFTYIAFALAYGLNALDAYVYANMRPFDVSEDLSLNADLKPTLLAESTPGIILKISLLKRSKTK